MGALLSSLLASFFSSSMELALLGLENAGKTTLLNVLADPSRGGVTETVPTVGLNIQVVKKGAVTMKCWDIAGQSQYRGEWSRYARGVDVICFVVDAADRDKLATARTELHRMLEDRALADTPLMIVANKIDIEPHVSEAELIKTLNLDYIMDQPWVIVPISARRQTNIDIMLNWLMSQRKGSATRASGHGIGASLLSSAGSGAGA